MSLMLFLLDINEIKQRAKEVSSVSQMSPLEEIMLYIMLINSRCVHHIVNYLTRSSLFIWSNLWDLCGFYYWTYSIVSDLKITVQPMSPAVTDGPDQLELSTRTMWLWGTTASLTHLKQLLFIFSIVLHWPSLDHTMRFSLGFYRFTKRNSLYSILVESK